MLFKYTRQLILCICLSFYILPVLQLRADGDDQERRVKYGQCWRDGDGKVGWHWAKNQTVYGELENLDIARRHMQLSESSIHSSFLKKVLSKSILKQHHEINVYVTGGSATSCGGFPHCWPKVATTRMYTELQRVRQHCQLYRALPLNLYNYAHGTTTSEFAHEFFYALSGEGRIEYDIMIIEFAINDHASIPTASCERRETDALIRQMLRANPHTIILFVYLWDLPRGGMDQFGTASFTQNLPLMQQYINEGYDVNWINVGGYMNEIGKYVSILHDHHHPAAHGESVIADLVNVLLLDKILAYEASKHVTSLLNDAEVPALHVQTPSLVPFSHADASVCPWFAASKQGEYDLDACRFDGDIYSMLLEEPTQSTRAAELLEKFPIETYGKEDLFRVDRQVAIKLPKCTAITSANTEDALIVDNPGGKFTHIGIFGRYSALSVYEIQTDGTLRLLSTNRQRINKASDPRVRIKYVTEIAGVEKLMLCGDTGVNTIHSKSDARPNSYVLDGYYMLNCASFRKGEEKKEENVLAAAAAAEEEEEIEAEEAEEEEELEEQQLHEQPEDEGTEMPESPQPPQEPRLPSPLPLHEQQQPQQQAEEGKEATDPEHTSPQEPPQPPQEPRLPSLLVLHEPDHE